MKVTVLMENKAPKELKKEWGLSLHISWKGVNYLLDTGCSDQFLDNAKDLKVNIQEVKYGVLSHAHFDHSGGINGFMRENETAPLLLRQGAKENCYMKYAFIPSYVGLEKGLLEKYENRIQFVDGDYEIEPGVYLVPHKTEGLWKTGKRAHMYVKEHGKLTPDSFSHEQSLVFDTEKGLIVFNCCSHGGADVIIKEVERTFPGKKVYAILGGFHLYGKPKKEIREIAGKIKDTGVPRVFTGHCTGMKAFHIIKEELGDVVSYMETGMVIEL